MKKSGIYYASVLAMVTGVVVLITLVGMSVYTSIGLHKLDNTLGTNSAPTKTVTEDKELIARLYGNGKGADLKVDKSKGIPLYTSASRTLFIFDKSIPSSEVSKGVSNQVNKELKKYDHDSGLFSVKIKDGKTYVRSEFQK